jgi:hypothetical protein
MAGMGLGLTLAGRKSFSVVSVPHFSVKAELWPERELRQVGTFCGSRQWIARVGVTEN